ncbi:hypothetical protein FRB99_002400 [Tulasnella sp. 403]|nr:hypothetical protein FRB99_002400 [Tulasnella sp. 403]
MDQTSKQDGNPAATSHKPPKGGAELTEDEPGWCDRSSRGIEKKASRPLVHGKPQYPDPQVPPPPPP